MTPLQSAATVRRKTDAAYPGCPVKCNVGLPTETSIVKTLSLQAKAAYCAKSRQSNYVASLRLEGYSVKPADAERKLPTREAVLKNYQQART